MIEYGGELHAVTTIDWDTEGNIYSVIFYPGGNYQMAFNANGRGEGFHGVTHKTLLLDLERRLKWSEADADV